MKKITVQFIENYPPYQKGDTATFFEREATRLTDRGFAVYVGGDDKRESQADRLRALRGAPAAKEIPGPAETRHIPGPAETRDQKPDATKSHVEGNRAPKVEGGAKKGTSGRGKGRGNAKK